MAELGADTSIYAPLIRQQQAQDPLHMLGQAVSIRNQLLAGQQMQMEQKAKQAYGKILQSSIDPETGKMDWKKAYTGLASTPDTAFLANEFLHQAAGTQQIEASTVLTHAQGVMEKLTAVGRYASPVATKGQNATKGDLLKAAQLAFADGVMDKKQLMGITAQITAIPGDVNAPNETAGQMATGMVQRAQSAAETMGQVLGENSIVNQGGVQRIVNVNRMTNKARFMGGPAATLAQEPTAAEKNQPIETGRTAAGDKIVRTRSTMGLPMEAGGLANPNGPIGPLTNSDALGNPGAASAPAGVQTPPSSAQPQGAATAPGSPPAQSSGVVLPNTSTYAEGKFQAGAEHRADLVKQTTQIESNLQQSAQAIKILDENKFKPGGLAGKKTEIAQTLEGLGVSKKITDAIAAGDLTDAQLIRKYLGQAMISYLNQNIARGAQTNYSLGVAENINPNMEMTPAALRKLLDFGRRMQKLKAVHEPEAMDAWVAAGNNPAEFGPEWLKALERKKYLGKLPE